uniref:nucleotidyltransferase family protein n=1 Tax=Paracoccus sp. TRP TaxID=412597 RepID=UPI000225F6D3|nr:NTP transferase domain-containing protein [Paracoccus sp. TRP]
MTRVGSLLAAGQSQRFGSEDKLLALWRGRPLVDWAAEALRAAGCDQLIAVVSSPQVGDRLTGFHLLPVPPGLPMSHSFGRALGYASEAGAEGLLICLGDMPNVDTALLHQLSGHTHSAACISAGRPMPPAYVAASDFAAARAAPTGDHGARHIIATIPPERLIAIDAATAHDIDRPKDLRGPQPC